MLLSAALPALLTAQGSKPLPLKYVGPPTKKAITAQDLMTRLYVFADDSMLGRQVGTENNNRGTAYIEREVRRMGLKPGGDNGTYFQQLPLMLRALDSTSTLTVDGQSFVAGKDFLARSTAKPKQFTDAEVIFGGTQLDTMHLLDNAAVRGKVVVMLPPQLPPNFDQRAFVSSNGFKAYQASLQGATVLPVAGEQLPPNAVRTSMMPTNITFVRPIDAPMNITITSKVAEALLGVPVANATKGMPGKRFSTNVRFTDTPRALGRNVVAILEGSDPVLKNEYVAVGAHNDHIGFNARPVDHDSLKAYMMVVRPQGADNPNTPPTPEQVARVRVLTDSLRAINGARKDSIFNGADDDASGVTAVLEIARQMKAGAMPKRTIIFAATIGEETGLQGTNWFIAHPPVPLSQFVANMEIEMIGRPDSLAGGTGRAWLTGYARSNMGEELAKNGVPIVADTRLEEHYFERSDNIAFARRGIVAHTLSSFNSHTDYHQVTDDISHVDFNHLAAVINAAAKATRLLSDGPKPEWKQGGKP